MENVDTIDNDKLQKEEIAKRYGASETILKKEKIHNIDLG